jgi:Major Facilitator Superfamily
MRRSAGGLSPANGSGPRGLLRYRSVQGRWLVVAMILGSSVAWIDSTVVTVALPAIGRNLHAGFQDLQWTVTSYTLTLASLILLAGSLSDRWGRRRVFLAGLGWFTLASVLCAAAPGIGWLIAARAVQGIGGALMTPASPCSPSASAGPPRHGGRRSSRLRCPTSPARSPSAAHRGKPADLTAAKQATPPVPPIFLHLTAPG